MALESRVVSEAVSVPAETAYAFARKMENLPLWASGLASGIEQRGGEWFTDSPMGKVKVAMAAENAYGVLDHDVTLPNGVTVHNALRVTPAGDGCVLTFIVLRMPGTTQVAFEDDGAHVQRDLQALKHLLESRRSIASRRPST